MLPRTYPTCCPPHENLHRYALGFVDNDVDEHLAICKDCAHSVIDFEVQDLALTESDDEITSVQIDITDLPPEIFIHPDTLMRELENQPTQLELVA